MRILSRFENALKNLDWGWVPEYFEYFLNIMVEDRVLYIQSFTLSSGTVCIDNNFRIYWIQ